VTEKYPHTAAKAITIASMISSLRSHAGVCRGGLGAFGGFGRWNLMMLSFMRQVLADRTGFANRKRTDRLLPLVIEPMEQKPAGLRVP
jgi:hypothetical protein